MPSIHVEEAIEEHEADTTPATAEKQVAVQKGISKNKTITLVVIVLIVVIALFALKTLDDKKELETKLNSLTSEQTENNDEALVLKTEVGQLMELPKDEMPTVATVVDADKVRSQPFFSRAQNGDKVLLFAQDGEAILYRPSTKKIIEVAPINIGSGTQKGDTSSTEEN